MGKHMHNPETAIATLAQRLYALRKSATRDDIDDPENETRKLVFALTDPLTEHEGEALIARLRQLVHPH